MNNLYDDQVLHDNTFTNTYSLWGNSKYYDIKNLSPQNYCVSRNGTIGSEIKQEFKASRWMSNPGEALAPEPPDYRNRRTIERESLYEDPDTFNKVNEESPSKSPTFDWTQFYWHKATEKLQDTTWGAAPGPSNRSKKSMIVGPNNIQKTLDMMLATPVKMTKAESMMQKMGWQGGALGRTGDGIVEPIAPNAVYAKKKIGFGQNHIQIKPPLINKKADSKQFFDMNVLLNIYEFVKNNSEVELLFDRKLRKDERKRIHHLVQCKLRADDLASVEFDSPAQMDLVLQISDKSCWVLNTQSSGPQSHRQLCLYKEAPPHVYLIIPDDLRDDEEEDLKLLKDEEEPKVEDKVEPKEEPVEEITKIEEVEVEEETNPFLISITRNLKKQTDSESEDVQELPEKVPEEVPIAPETPAPILPHMSKIMTRIVEYFTEFTEDQKFSQLKFLGPFTEEELSSINEFIEQAMRFLSKERDCPLACVFEKLAFEINEDCTGNTVIYKRPI